MILSAQDTIRGGREILSHFAFDKFSAGGLKEKLKRREQKFATASKRNFVKMKCFVSALAVSGFRFRAIRNFC